MDTPSELLAGGPAPEPAPRHNAGWFRRGDRRINREGRPRGSKVAAEAAGQPEDRAPVADRLMLLFVVARDLAWRLTQQNAPWMVNLPRDYQIVGCRLDAARQGIVLTIRSGAFPRIARGTPIPEFRPEFNGLRWRR